MEEIEMDAIEVVPEYAAQYTTPPEVAALVNEQAKDTLFTPALLVTDAIPGTKFVVVGGAAQTKDN
jgi:hypothetical protein